MNAATELTPLNLSGPQLISMDPPPYWRRRIARGQKRDAMASYALVQDPMSCGQWSQLVRPGMYVPAEHRGFGIFGMERRGR